MVGAGLLSRRVVSVQASAGARGRLTPGWDPWAGSAFAARLLWG